MHKTCSQENQAEDVCRTDSYRSAWTVFKIIIDNPTKKNSFSPLMMAQTYKTVTKSRL